MAASTAGIKAGKAFVLIEAVDKTATVLRAVHAKLGNFASSMTAMGSRLMGLGASLAAPLAFATKAASDAAETVNKFGAVFKDQAGAAGEFADQLAQDLGRSKYEIRDAMAAFQAFFVGMDFDPGRAREMSQQLESLAIDFGSFYNVSDTEAMERFISAMSGSSEVLDKFGINIKQAALETELLRMGVNKAWSEVSEAEKVQARFNIILRTMTDQGAVGDAAKTAGSFANQMKALQATIKDGAVAIGNSLLPVLTPLVTYAADAAKRIAEWATANGEAVITVAKVAAGVVAAGAALFTLGSAAGALSSIFGVLAAATTGLGAALTLLVANPIGMTIAAAGAATLAFLYFSGALGKAKDILGSLIPDFAGMTDASNQSMQALQAEQAALEQKAKRLAELRGKQTLSNMEQAEAAQLASELQAAYPALAGEINKLGTSADATAKAMEALSQAMIAERVEGLKKNLADTTAEMAKLQKQAQEAKAAALELEAAKAKEKTRKPPTGNGFAMYGGAMAEAHQSKDLAKLQAQADQLPGVEKRLETLQTEAERTRALIADLEQIDAKPDTSAPGFLFGLATSAATAGKQIATTLWNAIEETSKAKKKAFDKFMPDLKRSRAEAIDDPMEREIALLNIDFDERKKSAKAEGLDPAILEQTREQEIANIRERHGRDKADARQQLADQIDRELIEVKFKNDPLGKEKADIEMARNAALQNAKNEGLESIDFERINKLFDFKLQAAEIADAAAKGPNLAPRLSAGIERGSMEAAQQFHENRYGSAADKLASKADEQIALLAKLVENTEAGEDEEGV